MCQSILDKLENGYDTRKRNFENFEEETMENLYNLWPINNVEELHQFEIWLEESKNKKACVCSKLKF